MTSSKRRRVQSTYYGSFIHILYVFCAHIYWFEWAVASSTAEPSSHFSFHESESMYNFFSSITMLMHQTVIVMTSVHWS